MLRAIMAALMLWINVDITERSTLGSEVNNYGVSATKFSRINVEGDVRSTKVQLYGQKTMRLLLRLLFAGNRSAEVCKSVSKHLILQMADILLQ